MSEQQRNLVSAAEQEQISRTLRAWIETFSTDIGHVDFEFVGEMYGLSLCTIQSAYKTKQYIFGGYQAQYQFRIVYRAIAQNAAERLAMDELLNDIGAWMETETPPVFGENILVRKIRRDSVSAIDARYENGAEDHSILLSLIYEVS